MSTPPRRDQLVGTVERRGRFLTVRPFFERGPKVTIERDRDLREGQLVLVRTATARRGGAKVLRRLGQPDVARDVLEALMLDRGLRRSFARAVEDEARESASAPPDEGVRRRDLRDLPTFTVDPPDARDFDDAISAEELEPGRWRVHVHIADVSAYVRPGSIVDREATRRATSVYVPGAVEPMLPEALSNEACSLVPGVERRAVTVEMELHGAKVANAAFHRSLIRSDARLDYPQVDRIFSGADRAQDPWATSLMAARAAAHALEEDRERQGAIVVEGWEPSFHFDRTGHVVSLERELQTESHRLIEHLMIAANEAVAGLLERRGIPALYRVHEQPDPSRIEAMVDKLASLDVATPAVPETMGPTQAGEIAGEASRLAAAHARRTGHGAAALSSLVLRSLKQARYQPHNIGHAGLRSPRYCHFTSPIRRYPDLVCHRALLSAVGGGEDEPRAVGLEELAEQCSDREREAMSIERAADDVARCFLLERVLFEEGWQRTWEGEVVGLVGAGAFVQFGDGYEGFLSVRQLRGDWYELNPEETILSGAESKHAIRLGDPISVEVERVNAPRGRVDLLPAAAG